MKISDVSVTYFESCLCISRPALDHRQEVILEVDFRDRLEIDFLVCGHLFLI